MKTYPIHYDNFLKTELKLSQLVIGVGQERKMGELLRLAADEFDAFITMDGSIPYQQNLESIQIGIILLKADSNRDEDLAPLIPQVNSILKTLKKGEVVNVST